MKDLNKTKLFDSNIERELKKEYVKSVKDSDFENYIRHIHLPHEVLMRYTSRLETCFEECKNCSLCKGLEHCKNEVYGFRLKEVEDDGKLRFEYVSCKYKNKEIKDNKDNENVYVFDLPKEIKNAKMKEIFTDDKNRKGAITWLAKFIKEYDKNKKMKGLYLNGNFGCGKTYLISAIFNELAKQNIDSAIVFWPEYLRMLKTLFNDNNEFKNNYNRVKNTKLLLIDDLGAENNTTWSRDEILCPILQYRMENNLLTFITSNLDLNNLEKHLSFNGEESIKAKRIIERINQLTVYKEMISKNLR